MKSICTLFFCVLSIAVSAQLNEVVLSSYFKTVQPKQVQHTITYGTVVCGLKGTLLQEVSLVLPSVKADSCIRELANVHQQPKLLLDPKQKNVTGEVLKKSNDINSQDQGGVFSKTRISCGQRILSTNRTPMLVVDGNVGRFNEFSAINTNDIASVTILKSAVATAIYGPDGANGAIIVNLKLKYKQFVVVDAVDNSGVPRASVGLTMKNGDKTMFYSADDNGAFASNSPEEFNELQMTITAVGYETGTAIYNGDITKTDTIRLKRVVKICDPVILTSEPPRRRRGCGMLVRVTREKAAQQPLLANKSFRVYPNLVSKGGLFTTVIDDPGIVAIRIVSVNGRELLRQPVIGKSIVQIQTDSHWLAGIYFVQPLYENGRGGASAKMIIQ
jgi:TonB-dependent SusC/RagA subfamily outer membrane receptor